MRRTSVPARLAKFAVIGVILLSPVGLTACGTLVGAGVGGEAEGVVGFA